MSDKDKVYLRIDTIREADSIKNVLSQIAQMPEDKVKDLFKLQPHEVVDVKDVLSRSRIY